MPWTPTSWQAQPQAQEIHYPDPHQLAAVVAQLSTLPPLVTSWEIERLRTQLADAELGKRFILQGGDCAESFADCTPQAITSKLKILLQMSLVLVHGLKRPVVRVGRMAGQYAKPRSSATETRASATLPSYFGDLINRPAFDAASRTPDPQLLLEGYTKAALTMNFVRALVEGGFADLHHPEYWDMSFLAKAGLPPHLREQYTSMSAKLADGLRFMEALGEKAVDDLTRVEFFSSHEGLSLWYESAQTRSVPRRDGFYNLACHLPWIGERTRALSGAHVHFFAGIRNPVGVKVSANATPDELLALSEVLNPANEPGKLVFITRLGASNVERALPPLLTTLANAHRRCAWICDPMHANTRSITTGPSAGKKTRSFDDILSELTTTHAIHQRLGLPLAGVHFELTGDDVTECIGGAGGLSEADLPTNYTTTCDPRLNYHQALEMAFVVARLYA
jgi:3-deoxy-7-phosphoheptulonate synthase